MNKIEVLAPIKSIVHRSENPDFVHIFSPGICVLPSGRIIVTLDTCDRRDDSKRGYIYISDDKGESFRLVGEFPFFHARPFVAGNSVYILGHYGELRIIRSDDEGETWSEYSTLADGKRCLCKRKRLSHNGKDHRKHTLLACICSGTRFDEGKGNRRSA